MSRTPPSGRQQWADVAKGACIVLVVLWHVTGKDYLRLPWDLGVPVPGAWGLFSELLLPVRMPLFFLISGLFAARRLARPWPEVWWRRIAPLGYLFVLWTLVHTVVLGVATPDFDTAVAEGPRELLVQLTLTPGNLWYLLALAVYVAVARATRSAPHWALAGALLLSTAASAGLVDTPGNRAGLLANLVWFLLGTRVPHLPTPASARPRRGSVAVLVGVFVVTAGLWQVLDADAWFGVRPLLGLLGIAAGAAVAAVLATVPRLGPALAALGRETLPIYVLHLPLVALVHLGSARVVVEGSAASTSWILAGAYPLVLTAVVVGVCLVARRAMVAAGGWWLLAAPWGRRRVRAQP